MDPQILLMLLPLLLQSQSGGSGGGGPGVGAPIDPTALQDILGSITPGLFPTSGGTPSSGTATNGIDAFKALFSGNFNPSDLLALFGGSIGGLLGGLFSGVPRDLKTQEVGSGLARSGNPEAQMLADYVQNKILGQGNVLSSPGGAGFGKMAQILEWLSGNSLPGLSSGVADIGGVSGIPVPRDISRLNQYLGESPNLGPEEIASFLPQIENLVAGGGHLKNIAGQAEALINSVSGQQQAKGTGNVSAPGGAAGNPLAALLGGGGGGGNNIKQILDKLRMMVSPSGSSGNLVGATA